MNSRNKTRDIIVSGFALFAIFFGAGNLIFPPLLGNMAGTNWMAAMAGFLSTDPILPILGLIATAFVGGRAEDLGKRVSPKFAIILAGICILLIGPILSVPRTAATTFEIAIQPYISANYMTIAMVATSLIFFAITWYFSINEGKVIDIIGQFLTPGLLLVLAAIIIKAIFMPVGPIVETGLENAFHLGFTEGYQTMDALGAALMCGLVLTNLIKDGYTEPKIQRSMLIRSGIIAGILLALVYGGLTFVGAQTSSVPQTERVALLLGMVRMLYGSTGGVLIGITVALACITTAVGLTSTAGNFFSKVSNGRLSYKVIVTAVVIFSTFMSLLSVSGIIALAIPILSTIYPVVIVLILITLFDRYIEYDLSYQGTVAIAFVIGFIEAMSGSFGLFQGTHEMLKSIPLGGLGFPWVVPSVIFFVIFTLIGKFTGISKRPEVSFSENSK